MPPVLAAIDALARTVRSPAKREGLRGLRGYVVGRLDLLGYRAAPGRGPGHRVGADRGDLQDADPAAQAVGHEVDRDHAAAMMNLTAMYDSGQADAYWAKAA